MKKILAVLLFIALACCLVACSVDFKEQDVYVVKIAVDGIKKTEYVACDKLELSGASLIITYSDDTHEAITLTEEMLDPSSYDMDQPGNQTVVVRYGGMSASFDIYVAEWELTGVELASVPYVLNYVVGEQVDPKGATIKCSFEGEKTKYYEVTADMIGEYDNQTVGTTTVKLSYSGVQMSFDVHFEEKTPTKISIISDAKENFVFVGKGNMYAPDGMTVRLFFDNNESPKYNLKSIKEKDDAENTLYKNEDVFFSIDDSSPRSLEATLMYYPENYRETYSYTFYGSAKVSVGDKVSPGKTLASNSLLRDGQTIVLNDILSKSYGTVASVNDNPDGSKTMIVNTLTSYQITSEWAVKEGDIIDDKTYLGKQGTTFVYSTGGGLVQSIINGVVYIKTAVTAKFESIVKSKNFSSMEILSYPHPRKFPNTSIENMIEGDEFYRRAFESEAATEEEKRDPIEAGRVRVYFDDGSQEEFYMDDREYIHLVNAGSTSVNDTFKLTPGRNRVYVVYGGVMDNHTDFYVKMESKYPIALCLTEEDNKINGQTFYFGDRISVSTMSYYIKFNNGDQSDPEPLTENMVAEGCSLDCSATAERIARIRSIADINNLTEDDLMFLAEAITFSLPDKYLSMIPEEKEGTYEKPQCVYYVLPQPINKIEFSQAPEKVYVQAKDNISFDGSKLSVFYRNNTETMVDFQADDSYLLKRETVSDWNEIEIYPFAQEKTTDGTKRVYVFMKQGDRTELTDITAIIRKQEKGYTAKVVYCDEYNVRSSVISEECANFNYFLINRNCVVESIKVATLKDSDGRENYKSVYTQYESWDLSGLQMNVTFPGGQSTVLSGEDLWPEMIYDSSTNQIGAGIPVKFTYLGAKDENSLKIDVIKRQPTGIKIIRQGKSEYLENAMDGIDFSDYVFEISYNSGPSERISGNLLKDIPNHEVSSGWWYTMYLVSGTLNNWVGVKVDTLSRAGTVVYQLHYSYPKDALNGNGEYDYISTTNFQEIMDQLYDENGEMGDQAIWNYAVTVEESQLTVTGIRYEQYVDILNDNGNAIGTLAINPTAGDKLNSETNIPAVFNGIPVLSEVASGWELMLTEFVDGQVKEKVLTVSHGIDPTTNKEVISYVNITPEMLNYDVNDKTEGYRRVTITYKSQQTECLVYVWRAELTGVDVAIKPLQNYIYTAINSEEDLDLTGGIIRLTFTKYTRSGESAGSMTKYVDMFNEDVTYSGFIPGEYSKEGKQITINAVYKDYDSIELTASYVITVYDRQDVDFTYSNMIFFYGNAAPAHYTTKQKIKDFSLPASITMSYIETKYLITIDQYAALDVETQMRYFPVTMYDGNKDYAITMFILSDLIQYINYIDPAASSFYVKYGSVAVISEENYKEEYGTLFSRYFRTYIPAQEGVLEEGYYVEIDQEKVALISDKLAQMLALNDVQISQLTNEEKEEYDLYIKLYKDKVSIFRDVIIDKITVGEYANLSDELKADYEEMANEYYILMQVVDDRPLTSRYYETANYAFQNYTVIQKVIEVTVEPSNVNSKVLKVNAKKDDNTNNGNPFAIYYLTQPLYGVLNDIKSEVNASYVNSIYLASPNEDFFEIVVKFNEGYVETDETKEVVALIFYKVLSALCSDDFYLRMGVRLSRINFDIDGGFINTNYDFNVSQEVAMKSAIKNCWTTGINVFDKDTVAAAVENGEIPYQISFTLTFGDTKTRGGILQLLSGKMELKKAYDENEVFIGYTLTTGTLGHSSYTLDLSKNTVQIDGDVIRITTN